MFKIEKLDHGVLSMPNRTKNINSDLDKYKAEQAKANRRLLDDRKFLHEQSLRDKQTQLSSRFTDAELKQLKSKMQRQIAANIRKREGYSADLARDLAKAEINHIFKNKPGLVIEFAEKG